MQSFKNSKRSKEHKVQKTLYRISVKDRYNKRSELSRIREADQMAYYKEESNSQSPRPKGRSLESKDNELGWNRESGNQPATLVIGR